MSTKIKILVCSASLRDEISKDFSRVSFSTPTGHYIQNPHWITCREWVSFLISPWTPPASHTCKVPRTTHPSSPPPTPLPPHTSHQSVPDTVPPPPAAATSC